MMPERDTDGLLPSYAWPGGYPLYYLDGDDSVLCPACANKDAEYSYPAVASNVNWEDETLYCDDCGAHIESAYEE